MNYIEHECHCSNANEIHYDFLMIMNHSLFKQSTTTKALAVPRAESKLQAQEEVQSHIRIKTKQSESCADL